MIRKRIKQEENEKTLPVNNINNDNDFVNKPKSWKEHSCDVLNILESTGVNIYDDSRKPGMYLKRDKKEKITDIFKSKKQQNTVAINNKNNEQELINIFKQNGSK